MQEIKKSRKSKKVRNWKNQEIVLVKKKKQAI